MGLLISPNEFLEATVLSDAELRREYPADSYLAFNELTDLRDLYHELHGRIQMLQLDQHAPMSALVRAQASLATIKKVLAYFGERKATPASRAKSGTSRHAAAPRTK